MITNSMWMFSRLYIKIMMLYSVYLLCAKYGFAQSKDCPAQSIDQYFVQQSMDFFAHSMDCPVGTLCKVWISERNFVFLCGHTIASYR